MPLVSDKGDPILAHWQYGLGRAVAFTSDAKAKWARDWLGFPGLVIFTALLYLPFKMLLTIERRYAEDRVAAVARTWARPSSLSPGLLLRRPPENRFSVVCGVAPCRTSTSFPLTTSSLIEIAASTDSARQTLT